MQKDKEPRKAGQEEQAEREQESQPESDEAKDQEGGTINYLRKKVHNGGSGFSDQSDTHSNTF